MTELLAVVVVVALVLVFVWTWRRAVSPSPVRFDLSGIELDDIPFLGNHEVRNVEAPRHHGHVELEAHDSWDHHDTDRDSAGDSGWFSFDFDFDGDD
jgi:hypothetical protein